MQVRNVTEFVGKCAKLDFDGIYDLFEHETPDNVRADIYAYAAEDANEPARAAFNALGHMYDVESLKNY